MVDDTTIQVADSGVLRLATSQGLCIFSFGLESGQGWCN